MIKGDNKRYFVLYHRNKFTGEIFTTMSGIADRIGVSDDTIRRRIDRAMAYVSSEFIVFPAWGIQKSEARAAAQRAYWQRMKSNLGK